MKGTNQNMKQMNLIKNMALFAILYAANAVQAGTIEAIAAPSTTLFRDNSGNLLNGAYLTIGSFGERTSSQVADLFRGVTSASDVGSLLRQNYTSLITPGYFTSSNQFIINNGDGYEPNNLSTFNNTPIYAVLAKQLDADLFQIGVFGAYNFTRAGTSGAFTYNPTSQISFASLAAGGELGVDTLYFKMRSTLGALAVDGLGSSTLPASGAAVFSLSSVTSTSVPEPSSSALMLLGATALVALRRLRKNV
jgi:hypothetical protein